MLKNRSCCPIQIGELTLRTAIESLHRYSLPQKIDIIKTAHDSGKMSDQHYDYAINFLRGESDNDR